MENIFQSRTSTKMRFGIFCFNRKLFYLSVLTFLNLPNNAVFAQSKTEKESDTLSTVIVEAFSSKTKWKTTPVSVAIIKTTEILRASPVSMLPVLNTIPGVRMEERSPGSYRLSIRGSLLRSPFGVRNVKIYMNAMPLSDATGNTYLNLLDIQQMDGMELLKGPSASIYGAGTGGVLLLKKDHPFKANTNNQFHAGLTVGSFGLVQEQAGWDYQSSQFSSSLQISHVQQDGYREQSALKKTVAQYTAAWQLKQHKMELLSFYANLYYQTPGGISLAQMQSNPTLSRQATSTLPSAIEQQASITNKTVYVGIQDTWNLNARTTIKSFLTLNNTQFENPFITNYEFRNETNGSAGIQWQWSTANKKVSWINGFEWLYNHSRTDDYGNKKGKVDTVQFKDNIIAKQWTVFSQLQWNIGNITHLQAGISLNQQKISYQRLTDNPLLITEKPTDIVAAPRVAVLVDISKNVSGYGIVSYGFSPPSLAELRPSDGKYYGELQPEKGWNMELGLKGFLLNSRLQYDLNFYRFTLNDAIVRRNNSAGAEYFVNAGNTLQQGIEAMVQYQIIPYSVNSRLKINIWTSYAFQPYHFENYQQGIINYSGNELTGVPRTNWVNGLDLELLHKWYLNASINVVSRIPLNDANDIYADAYQLVQIKAGYRFNIKQTKMHVFAGADNLLNQLYSLGNDINAAGRRYFNPAVERNFYIGFDFRFH
jgi:iron complex outermembrane recepter protein